MNLTESSLALFAALAKDAKNWSGRPMLDITNEQRGNLTDLKRKKLLTTHSDEGLEWVFFSHDGKALAASIGHPIIED